MDVLSSITTIATALFDAAARRVSLVCDLRENLECLREEMKLLSCRCEDLENRVELEKQQQLIPRREVQGWLEDVHAEKSEVAAILQQGDALMEKKCLGRCWGISSSYKFGKRVSRKTRRLKELKSRGDFEEVACRWPRAVVDELPLGPTVGLDSLYTKVCRHLGEDEKRIIALYGRRGIGKTTLMKKINNGLLGTEHEFDTVIWISVPKEESFMEAIQEVIRNKLRIIDDFWPNRCQAEKATEIFKIMKTRRFLVMLDNVRKPFDLTDTGIPLLDPRNRSKVIFTTRFYDKSIIRGSKGFRELGRQFPNTAWVEVMPLARENARKLFCEQLGKDTLNCIPMIHADCILDRCQGLPSALIRAGRALDGCKNVGEWIQLTPEVEELIDEEISGENGSSHCIADEMPLGHNVGLGSLYMGVWNCLTESKGGIIGLYGTGGVGKTTLMKKIYNECLKKSHRFNPVIWVVMSKQANVGAAQEVIRNKLKIADSMWQSRTVDERAREIFNIMKTKKFMLLLDDVWQHLDLLEIGVPPLPEIKKHGSKVIFTTRFQKICNEMEVPVQRQFRVEVLAQEDALALFLEKVGKDTLCSHPDIPQLAEKVAERCKGLPLALVTVGRAMAGKNSPEAWDQAIHELEKFPAEISGIEEGLFHVLKLSYDSLKDERTKSCFIYYSLFPKEYEIRNDELIEHWIGEGFFDGKDIYEARRHGLKIIEDLKNACLLEEGDEFKECVKMHDVIHDMALWIGHECGKRMNKIFVSASLALVDIERRTNWQEAKTISLWGRNIERLPEAPYCSNIQTLFVRECIQLKTFPREFFQFMPLLRVLDLSATHGLIEIPKGIDRLTNLEYMNLSMTHIKELPIEMMKLKKLRCLLLNGMLPLIIPPHVISSLSMLQLFSMHDGNALSGHRATLLVELESLEPLDEISLSFRSVVALNKLLTSHKLQRCIRRLSIYDCEGLVLLELSSIFLNYLETLEMFNCLQLEEIKINVDKEGNKDFGEINELPIPNLIVTNNQHFHKLRDVKIWSCPKLLNLAWLIYAVHLQSLNVQFCKSMKEVISCPYIPSGTQHVSIFTRLKSLVVGVMPMLESIYEGALLFPSLEVISVINCPRLVKLPLNSNSATKSLNKIEGDVIWWKSLEWEDESTKDIFTSYFSPQYLADPIHPSGEMKGKKKLGIEGSTSRLTI